MLKGSGLRLSLNDAHEQRLGEHIQAQFDQFCSSCTRFSCNGCVVDAFHVSLILIQLCKITVFLCYVRILNTLAHVFILLVYRPTYLFIYLFIYLLAQNTR